MRPAPSSSSPVNRGRPTRSSGSASGHETTRNTCQRHYIRRCSVNPESIPSKLETTSAILRQWAIKTQPLSNCVLHASAYQRTRERNTGIARKNIAMPFEDYLAKEGCLEDPFSKQILRNYQPCVSTPKLLNNTKNVSISKTLSISTLAQYFILQLWRNIPLTTMTSIECACSTLAVSLKRWDVEAGTIKRTSQRNKGMAEWHTKSSYSLNPFY